MVAYNDWLVFRREPLPLRAIQLCRPHPHLDFNSTHLIPHTIKTLTPMHVTATHSAAGTYLSHQNSPRNSPPDSAEMRSKSIMVLLRTRMALRTRCAPGALLRFVTECRALPVNRMLELPDDR